MSGPLFHSDDSLLQIDPSPLRLKTRQPSELHGRRHRSKLSPWRLVHICTDTLEFGT